MDPKPLITIKVLRLVRPTMIGPLALSCDKTDLMGDLWEKELRTDVTASRGIPLLSLGQFLRLPQGFGNMYLGETFSCYVVIQNESPVVVTNVSVKIDLQTASQKFVLSDGKTMESMRTGETIDILMQHEIKEMGKHMLICTLSYTLPSSATGSSEPIHVERFFKFQVKKPLDVKTKLYNAEADEVYLEAQVQNITAAPLCLEKVDLEPSQAFSCIPMNQLSLETQMLTGIRLGIPLESPLKLPSWNSLILDTEESHQFLYRLVPKTDTATVSSNIGKLDIVWKTTMGASGRLQTSQLQRQVPAVNDLKLVVIHIPATWEIDSLFTVTCKLINTTTDRDMDLRLELDAASENYCWAGVTKTRLGMLAASSDREIQLEVFPLNTGIVSISNIRVVDLSRGEKFCFNDVAQVFILQKSNSNNNS